MGGYEGHRAADPDNLLTTAGARLAANRVDHIITSGTWVVNPNLVTSSRFSYLRLDTHGDAARFFSPRDVGIDAHTLVDGIMDLGVSGFFDIGCRTCKRDAFQQQIQFGNDTSWIAGAHQLSFGFIWTRDWMNRAAFSRAIPDITIRSSNTGNAMGDFLTGQINQIRQGARSQLNPHQNYISFYGQDSWSVTPRLTLNLGLRWEPYLPFVWDPGEGIFGGVRVYRFSREGFFAGEKSVVFPNAPAGFTYTRQQMADGPADFDGRSPNKEKWALFAPRVGLAWDTFGDGRTSIRASYGISYDTVPMANQGSANNVAPWSGGTEYRRGTLDDPYLDFPGGNPFPFDFREDPKFLEGSVFTPYPGDGDLGQPTVQSWNLSVQRELAANVRLSVTYLGSQTTHLWETETQNPVILFPGRSDSDGNCFAEDFALNVRRANTTCSTSRNLDARRELLLWAQANGTPQHIADAERFAPIDVIRSAATSNYHGLSTSLRGAVASINLNANYTWGHCISDGSNGIANIQPNEAPIRPNTRDRSNCNLTDRRHIFNLTGVYALPTFFTTPFLRAVASDWSLAIIGRVSSGHPLSIVTGTDRALNGLGGRGSANQPVDQLLDDVKLDTSGDLGSQFLNKAAFAQPSLGTIGNMGFRSVRGVKTWAIDGAVTRTFQLPFIGEGHLFQLRAEAFNLFNSTRPMNPSTNFRSGTFGRITNVEDPRIMQFALKYAF